MRQYHLIHATRLGWGREYEAFYFPTDELTREEAMALFRPVNGYTRKNDQNLYPYDAVEYEGERFRSCSYIGIVSEDEIPAEQG